MATKSPTPINRLILIGNGFDLAHRMKTNYEDFILWYFNKYWAQTKKTYFMNPQFINENIFSNELLSFSYNRELTYSMFDFAHQKFNSLSEIKELIKSSSETKRRSNVTLTIKSEFFKSVVGELCHKNWVDIENQYYSLLTKIIKEQSSLKNQSQESYINSINNLNNEFEIIKQELEQYLTSIETSEENTKINEFLYESPVVMNRKETEGFELGQLLLLNFNYTQTAKNYLKSNADIIHIHGELNNENNPIIFGYGDERDETYEILEKANIPNVFTHIKSFDYFKTNNYARLLAFLEAPFDLYIMGHSCGLSDRTLLSTIFEHDNCRLIKIFYYENLERYRETTYEMSRHFTSKAEMRRKVINFKDCSPMPQLLST